jgi:hypothetical protein
MDSLGDQVMNPKFRTLLLVLLSQAAAVLAQTESPNRAPSATEQSAVLAAIREYALNYTQRLPDYSCMQVTKWGTTGTASLTQSSPNGQRPLGHESRAGVIEAQVGVVDHRELHKITTINGKPAASADLKDLPDMYSHGEFGTQLGRIFDPQTATEFQWDRWAARDGRRMYVFSYRVPKTKGYIIQDGKNTAMVAFKGLVYADFETKAVMRIEMQCTDFPADSSYQDLDLSLNYKLTRVAEQEFVLPADFKLIARRSNGYAEIDDELNAQYKDYRRFSADATIQFDAEK